jgi:hypothetical protein
MNVMKPLFVFPSVHARHRATKRVFVFMTWHCAEATSLERRRPDARRRRDLHSAREEMRGADIELVN